MLRQFFHMQRGRIAFVLREAILGKQTIQLRHFAVARHLGDNRRRADLRDQAIPLHYRLRRHRQRRAAVAVYQHKIGRNRQTGDRALHRQHGGVQNIEPVNLFRLGAAQAPRQRFFFDLVEQSETALFR